MTSCSAFRVATGYKGRPILIACLDRLSSSQPVPLANPCHSLLRAQDWQRLWSRDSRERLYKLEVLVLDEVSMVSGEMFEALEQMVRRPAFTRASVVFFHLC